MHYDKPDRLLFGGQKKRTTEIFNEIHIAAKAKPEDEFAELIHDNASEFSCNPQVGEYIKGIVQSRGENFNIPQLAEVIGISRAYLYQIIPVGEVPPKTVKTNPDRKILLALALELKFSVDETQHLLKYANQPELYPRRKFDAVILYALERRLKLVRTNILLESANCEPLLFNKKQTQSS